MEADQPMALLEVEDVSVRFGGVTALDGLSFSVEAGQVCALIGPNGAGKTTLFNVISRLYEASNGSVRFDGADLLAMAPHQIDRTPASPARSRTWRWSRA
jgi:branched-chain amino acid transport system ATP-binding protein